MQSKPHKARDIMINAYGSSRNFVTPDLIRYGKINKVLAYELSCGEFGDKRIYGVTVAEDDLGGRHDLSKGGFKSLREAENYITELRLEHKYGIKYEVRLK